MKKLFVIHRIDNNTNKNKNLEIFHYSAKKDSENNCSILKLSDNQLNIVNNFPSTTTSYSTDSIKYSLNFSTSELSPSIKSNNQNIEVNKYLGKKKQLNKEDISEEYENNIKQNLDNNTTLNEEFQITNSFDINNSKKNNKKRKAKKEKKPYINEGRWSNEEHIKFIEALIEYGKNWKKVQKYVGTRSTSQARSHAQKFYFRLKMFKDTNLDIDFTSNNIKNLSDIIQEIKGKNKNNENEKKFIFNFFIYLNEIISKENNKSNKRKKEINLNNNNNTKLKIEGEDDKINFNNLLNNIKLNEEQFNESKINEINNEKKFQNNIKTIYRNNNSNEIEKNIIQNINKKDNEESINYIEQDSWKDNLNNNKLIFDDGIAFYEDEFQIFNYNNINERIKEYDYNSNFESPSIFNKYFFS